MSAPASSLKTREESTAELASARQLHQNLGPGSNPPPADFFGSEVEHLPTEEVLINVGPSHPVTHGTVRFLMRLDGETIAAIDPEIGYLHRGFEKQVEAATWTQVFPYTDRLNYVSPMLNNVGYAMAVEKLCGIEAPIRAQYLRTIGGEIHRICRPPHRDPPRWPSSWAR